MKVISLHSLNKLIVETYKEDRALKATVNNGFAMVSQKVSVKGLKLLVDASVCVGMGTVYIPAGATVYIKESSLQSAPWAKQSLTSDSVQGEFMIIDPIHMEYYANLGE